MNKSILVIDTPENCHQCDIENGTYCGATHQYIEDEYDDIPEWCPLKEVPQRKEQIRFFGNGSLGINNMAKSIFNDGYNACIDDILEGSEDNAKEAD